MPYRMRPSKRRRPDWFGRAIALFSICLYLAVAGCMFTMISCGHPAQAHGALNPYSLA